MKKETTVKLQYIGRRISDDGLMYCFLLEGKEVFFTKNKWGSIGNWYGAEKKDGGLLKPRNPEQVDGPEPSAGQVDIWEALDQAAYAESKRRKTAERFEKKPQIFEPLRALLPAFQKLSFRERRQFINAIDDWLNSQEVQK